jgi:aminobenzoyl-glutamate utilization protein B
MRIKGARSTALAAIVASACAAAVLAVAPTSASDVDKASIIASVDAQSADTEALADAIWDLAEVGYQEVESSRLLQQHLEAAGFTIETDVAGMPTAFMARYRRGAGGGVVGLLAEFDALPGVSQDRVAERTPTDHDSAHACGHNLMGAGAAAAAIAVKDWLDAAGVDGEIRVYGTPAEEGGSGKVYMTRAGLFDDVDAVLHWHPDDENSAGPTANLANRSGRFIFTGVAAHAAGAPERGRSALDGVEAMNFMVNLMREHMPRDARVHYVITDGGDAPNVVPEHAEVYYYVRHSTVEGLEELWRRVADAARAGALGTGTEVQIEVMHGNHPLLPNEILQRQLYANMNAVGGVTYTPEERAFAEEIRASIDDPSGNLGDERRVKSYRFYQTFGSTDVGDVSWAAPTGGVRASTWPPGATAHSWQAAAASGMSIGHKGMEVAAKTLALTAADLLADPALRASARNEFADARGEGFEYHPLLGERDPPLDYRLAEE